MKHRIWKLTAAALTMAVALTAAVMPSQAAKKDEKWANTAKKIAQKTGTEEVKTIRWSAKIKRNIKQKVDTNLKTPSDKGIGTKIKVKKGTRVTVIQRDYHEKAGVSQCMLKNGRVIYVPNKYLYFTAPICTGSKGDYSRETKEAYINGQTIKSGDKYLLWVSLDKQRVNVFTGSSRNWKLIKVFKTSTGKADAPTLDQSFLRDYRIQWKKKEVTGLYFYSAVYGSGIHRFPGSGASKALGIKPISHSCIRLAQNNAIWIYNNTSDKKTVGKSKATRVWIW